ncbi:fibroblast growth factor 17-like [Orbicella faveolata]|uniref:fibroblast growth factor 17-like n=1 Tax=Orbicella faveolata TaxID=48498 RepID=UPI0009E1E92E|nr:fibroblast growth factor 17-like [Orbicella faveolata]
MKYSITVTLWSALAVLIFTRIIRTVAFPLDSTVLKSVSIERSVWLFSTNTNKFVRVEGSNVDALGRKTDASAKLQLESTYVEGFGVGVRIRSVTENSYLCVNPNGDLTLEVHGNTLDRCVFSEDFSDGYTTFQSMYNTSWYLGFKRNGKVKQPHNTTNLQKAARFMPYKS